MEIVVTGRHTQIKQGSVTLSKQDESCDRYRRMRAARADRTVA